MQLRVSGLFWRLLDTSSNLTELESFGHEGTKSPEVSGSWRWASLLEMVGLWWFYVSQLNCSQIYILFKNPIPPFIDSREDVGFLVYFNWFNVFALFSSFFHSGLGTAGTFWVLFRAERWSCGSLKNYGMIQGGKDLKYFNFWLFLWPLKTLIIADQV